jgi:chromosome segregation ATPase
LDNFRTKLHDYVAVDETVSLDDIAQQIVDQATREREDFNERYQALERANNDLQSRANTESIQQFYMNTVNELNQELLAMKEAYNELDTEKQVLANELEKQSAEMRAAQARQTFGMFLISST